MDDLDVRIFKELGNPSSLQWNVRETYSNIARRLGIDEETVRRRLKKAEKLGSLPGWRMMINPHIMDCEAACLDLDVGSEETKDRVISEISQIDGVIKILDFRGKGLQVTLYYPDEDALRKKIELIYSLSTSLSVPTVWEVRFPKTDIRMTETDWMIIWAMLDDARKSLGDVSKKVGVSTRTIERRLTKMSEARVVYLQGTPNFKNFAGLSCVFLVFCPNSERKKLVDEAVLSKARRIELANTSAKQYTTFVTAFDNLSESDEFMKWLRSLDGVESVKMGIVKELIVIQDIFRKAINTNVSSS
ncbi:MAG: AsnC family transcriptional regulator [Thaumarchaeota archaeon]|nr:AsnC family transcriptional regulator [Nitrososphaerota archaeon]